MHVLIAGRAASLASFERCPIPPDVACGPKSRCRCEVHARALRRAGPGESAPIEVGETVGIRRAIAVSSSRAPLGPKERPARP
jgi:hypothetical protein